MRQGSAESYWMDSTEPTSFAHLADDVEVDVAVVGGGIAGLCTAWELARAGLSVAVLEADRIAAGVTGYTTAKLTAQHGLIYAHLRSKFDEQAARWYAHSQLDAIDHVAGTVAELGIDCDLERLPAFSYLPEGKRDQIEAEVQAARLAGLPASLVTETGLPYPVGAAIRVEQQAQFHPRRYLLALAADLVRRGGRVFERTRIVDLDEGGPCRLTSEAGATVTARDVVVATHYPIFDRAGLFTRLVPHRELVVAAVIEAHQDPGGMYVTPEENTRSVRTAPYDNGRRLLIVTGESYQPGTPGVTDRLDRLATWTRDRFPVDSLAYHWAAQDNTSTDRVPYIGRLHPGTRHVYVATGFNAWGMTNGVLAGRLLAALITGENPPWSRLYDPRRLHPTVEAVPFVKAAVEVARRFVGDRIRPASHADSPDQLAPGDGAVIRIAGERRAVYRDGSGRLHAVSATCTHLGCLVAFNDEEKTWDCPCHGSRFDTRGGVLHGPATEPLRQHPIPPGEGSEPTG
ncbi:FAD-dependent oxidoreductase [Plantactinospora sonchi]|uniref:FAD-dependent oxidoreductase n=1 Tax=Plantactinospora sonchi TaxID=1544735 RepID=A0ABU7S2W3_9ACTN